MSGASPVPVTLIEAYAELGIEIHQVYGLTESCGPACLISPDEALARAGSTGKEFFFTKVRVVDEDGDDVPPGTPGELICQGPHVMVGYWNRPEATAETIVDGWLHTGDIAIVDKDGYVYIQRPDQGHDHQRRRERVPGRDRERAPRPPRRSPTSPSSARPSERWGETPLAVVVRTDDALTEADVLAYTDGKLARYKRPTGRAFVDEIPRNPTGKALKRVLREQFPDPAP